MREIKACSGVSASAKLRINLYFANVMIEFFSQNGERMAGESMCRWEKAVKWEKGGR
jgi:hypothetical protein